MWVFQMFRCKFTCTSQQENHHVAADYTGPAEMCHAASSNKRTILSQVVIWIGGTSAWVCRASAAAILLMTWRKRRLSHFYLEYGTPYLVESLRPHKLGVRQSREEHSQCPSMAAQLQSSHYRQWNPWRACCRTGDKWWSYHSFRP